MDKNTIIQAIVSIFSVISAAFWAPKVQWKVDKEKKKHENRQLLLTSVKKLISQEDITRQQFFRSIEYKQLRPHIKKEVIDKFEKKNQGKPGAIELVFSHVGHLEVDPFKQLICDEVARLEKEWELI